MVRNVLARQLPVLGRERIDEALARVGIDPDRRPQTLAVEEWLALAEALDLVGPTWRARLAGAGDAPGDSAASSAGRAGSPPAR